MNDEAFSFRWGVPLLDAGHTNIPNVIIDHYTQAGVSRAEFLAIIHLARYQYESPAAECRPSVQTVASAMGYTKRGLQKVLSALEKRSLLNRHYRPGSTTIYDFSGFSRAVLSAARGELEFTPETVRDEPQFTGGDEPQFIGEVNSSSPEEEKKEKYQEQEYDTTSNDETRQWIADLEAQPPTPRPAPRTTEELMEGTRQASEGWRRRLQEQPHLTWGNQSDAAQRALAALDGHADDIRWIGQQMEEVLHLAPDWTTPKAVRFWIAQILEALKAAGYDRDLVIEAGHKLRKDGCTVAGPKSLVNTARALAAEQRGGDHANTSAGTGAGGTRWTADDIARAAAEAAAALDA